MVCFFCCASIEVGQLALARVEDFYQARDLLKPGVRYHNEERPYSALDYLRPVDYYEANPEALLVERKRKLAAASIRRKEVNRQVGLMETRAGGVLFYHGPFVRRRLKHYAPTISCPMIGLQSESYKGALRGTGARTRSG